MAKKTVEVSIMQITENGGYRHPFVSLTRGEATFSASFNTCYFGEKTFKKIKGGRAGGNYIGVEDGEIYRISQNRD